MAGKTGSRKHGRAARKPKTARYKNNKQREKNKLCRIRQSSGVKACREYAARHLLTSWAKERGLL